MIAGPIGPHGRSSRPPRDLPSVLDDACARAGLPRGARLLRHFSNAVYLLDHASVVARIGYGQDIVAKATAAVRIATWLAEQDFPVTAPVDLPSGHAQPIVGSREGQHIAVTFWRYYPQPPGRPWPDTTTLGRLAAALHRLPNPPMSLGAYRPLRSLSAVINDSVSAIALRPADREWLRRRVDELRTAFDSLDFPLGRGLIHADMYTGNLLWNTTDDQHPIVLGDWDSTCIGPREVDLIPTYHEPRFGSAANAVHDFAHAYGHDLTTWPGFPVLYGIRELSTLTALVRLARTNSATADELSHRLRTLRGGDLATPWHGQ